MATLSFSGPGGLHVGPRRCIVFSLEACTAYCMATEFWIKALDTSTEIFLVAKLRCLCSSPCRSAVVCVGSRRSLCRGPALSASGGPALFVWGPALFVLGLGALYVRARIRARRSLPLCLGPRRFLCDALAVLGPGALCVGAGRSLCRGPALSVLGPGALSV